MDPLTTTANLVAMLGRDLTEAETARAPGAIASASTRIRTYTRQQFDLIADDVVVLPTSGGVVVLPQQPVVDVTLVRAVSGLLAADPVTVAGWSFDGVDRVHLAPFDSDVWLSYPSWVTDGSVGTVEVTYSHGYAEVPPAVADVATNMVLRTLLSPSLVAGMVNERIGQYSYQLQQGSGAQGIAVQLNDDDKAQLAPWRRKATTIQTSAM